MKQTTKELLAESIKRRSYRKFLEDPVDMDVIEDCIRIAGTAPSGANMQPWHFCIVTSSEIKQAIQIKAEANEREFYKNVISDEWRSDLKVLNLNTEKPFLTQAPCLIVIFKENYRIHNNGRRSKNYYVNESVGISIGLLINAIRNAGYASLTYTPPNPQFLRKLLNRPEGEMPVMILCVGKPDESYELPELTRKSLDEIAAFFLQPSEH